MDAAVAVAVVGCIQAVIVAVIGGIISSNNKKQDARAAREVKRDEELAAITDGMRSLLRNELVRMHREYVEGDGSIALESLEYAEQTYNSYHALKGNGSGDKLWNDIRALPIKD